MSDEFNQLPEIPEGDSQGGHDVDSGANAQPPAQVDLTTLPEFRAWQSKKDREVAEAKRLAEEERRARLVAEQRAHTVVQAVSSLDQDAAARLIEQAEIAELRRYREETEYERQVRNWQDQTVAWGESHGLDTNSAEFRQALADQDQEALNELYEDARLEKKLQERLAKMGVVQPQTPPAETPSQPAQKRQTAATPPMGGGAPYVSKDVEELSGKLIELQKEPTKNAVKIAALKEQIKQAKSR